MPVQVTLSLQSPPDWVILAIRDDSQGISPEPAPTEWMGVRIVHERAEITGARFQINRHPGQGMRVSVNWPD
jgi:signal transduction histidine kinase